MTFCVQNIDIRPNNVKNVTHTGEGREINRHNFTLEEIDKAYNKTVVQRLLKLIDFRNDYPAFDGDFIVEDSDNNKIILTWKKDDKYCTLNVDLNTSKSTIKYMNNDGDTSIYTLYLLSIYSTIWESR